MAFSGDVVLVSGASRGIGAAIASSLAKSGLFVIVNYLSSEKEASELCESIMKDGGRCELVRFDVSNFEECGKAVQELYKKHKSIDYLVNNAGITVDNLLLRMTEEEFDKVISVNLKSVFNLTKHVVRFMIKKKFGAIVNMSSIVALMGNAGQSNYATSKAGIIGFTKSLAKEVGSRNIRVNAIAPGFIETDMTKKLNILQKKMLVESIVLKRLGTPEDVANVVKFLLSDESSYITGETINVSGGLYI